MKSDEKDLLAAEFVLGTLDAKARGRVARRLPGDPALQEAVEIWRARLGGLEAEPEPIEPPAELWERIEADLDQDAAEPFALTIRQGEGHWEPFVEGIDRKMLYIDRDQGYQSFLLRFSPGSRLRSHPHSMVEECMMLEGEVTMAGQHLMAGDYQVISAGTTHPEIYSETGALVYVRGELSTKSA